MHTLGAVVSEGLERELSLLARYMIPGRRPWDGERLLDRSAYLLLQRLEDQGPMSIGELADAFSLDRSTINRQTAALTRHELARRVPDPAGGVARKFEITEVGRERLEADRTLRREGIGEIVKEWTPDEVKRFELALRRFNQCMEDSAQTPWPRAEADGEED
jgi:DNA-binding MarR family transcriptional regulator